MKKLSLIILSIVFFSCGGSSTSTETENTDEKVNTTEVEESTSTSSKNCLEDYRKKPENLLSQDVVEKNVDTQGMEINSISISGLVEYTWDFDDKTAKVQLSGISEIADYVAGNTPTEKFFFMYHNPTEEEKAANQKALDKAAEDSDNKDAKAMLSAMGNIPFDYENVSGIGDAAVWQHTETKMTLLGDEMIIHNYTLIVLVGNATFSVETHLEKGRELDKEKAEAIAKELVAKACK